MALFGQFDASSGDAVSRSFHRHIPTDARFVQITRRQFTPDTTITQKDASFSFPPSPQIYLFNDIELELKVKLRIKGTDLVPPDDALVGVVNNTMHSLISDLKLSINGVPSEFCKI